MPNHEIENRYTNKIKEGPNVRRMIIIIIIIIIFMIITILYIPKEKILADSEFIPELEAQIVSGHVIISGKVDNIGDKTGEGDLTIVIRDDRYWKQKTIYNLTILGGFNSSIYFSEEIPLEYNDQIFDNSTLIYWTWTLEYWNASEPDLISIKMSTWVKIEKN